MRDPISFRLNGLLNTVLLTMKRSTNNRRIKRHFLTVFPTAAQPRLSYVACGVNGRRPDTRNLSHTYVLPNPDYEALLFLDKEQTQALVECVFATKRSNAYFHWYDLVVSCFLQFSVSENKTTEIHFKVDSIALSTLMLHLSALTQVVMSKNFELVPACFVLMCDSWSSDMTRIRHYRPYTLHHLHHCPV